MVWFKNDDAFYSHPKVVSIPRTIRAEALGTWTLCGTWASHHLTDGAIPRQMVDELGGSQAGAAALVKAGLWSRTRTGYLFGSWGEYQPTRAEVEASREAERKRKADYRARQRRRADGTWGAEQADEQPAEQPAEIPPGGRSDVSQWDTGGRPAGTPAGVPPHPTRPDPTRTNKDQEQELLTESSSVERPPSTALALVDTPAPPSTRSQYPAAFEDFWQVFPRHEGKRKALTAWQSACRRASADEILIGAIRYRDDPNREPAYTAHPTTWLNRDGWTDAPLPQRRPASQQDRLAAAAERMFTELSATRGA